MPVDAPAKPRPKPRLVKKPDPVPELQDSDIEVLDSPPVALVAPDRSTKAKGKQKAAREDGRESDIEMGEVRKEKKKVKKKETEKETETREPTKAKVAKPKKIPPSEGTDETHSKTKEKANSRKRASPDPPKKSKAKPSQPREDSEDAAGMETDTAPKKKKRKINLFGGSQPSTFDWNSLTQVLLFSVTLERSLTLKLHQAGEGLGIPTRLSPMKETDAVPRRLGRASKG